MIFESKTCYQTIKLHQPPQVGFFAYLSTIKAGR